MTHTYAELEVSEQCFREIEDLLREAEYGHAFMPDGVIDMHGIGLKIQPPANSGPTFELIPQTNCAPMGIKCLVCERTSWNQNDVKHRYCAGCHQYHSVMSNFGRKG